MVLLPELKGRDVKRFSYNWKGNTWIKYGKWLAAPREPKYFEDDRIILRQIPGKKLVATIINEKFCIDQTVFIAKPKNQAHSINYFLGIINSSLMGYYFKYKNEELDEVFPKVKLKQFKEFPIKISDKYEKELVSMVNKILLLNDKIKAMGSKKTDSVLKIQLDISDLERKIDYIVYKIYGIAEKEQKIIEESLQ